MAEGLIHHALTYAFLKMCACVCVCVCFFLIVLYCIIFKHILFFVCVRCQDGVSDEESESEAEAEQDEEEVDELTREALLECLTFVQIVSTELCRVPDFKA